MTVSLYADRLPKLTLLRKYKLEDAFKEIHNHEDISAHRDIAHHGFMVIEYTKKIHGGCKFNPFISVPCHWSEAHKKQSAKDLRAALRKVGIKGVRIKL